MCKYNNITRKAKRTYYENLDLKVITDSKKLWSTVKPLFTLKENGKLKAIIKN